MPDSWRAMREAIDDVTDAVQRDHTRQQADRDSVEQASAMIQRDHEAQQARDSALAARPDLWAGSSALPRDPAPDHDAPPLPGYSLTRTRGSDPVGFC